MLKYILKRLIQMIPVVLIISVLIFGMLKMMPGDPVKTYLGSSRKITPEMQERVVEKLGLDKPIYVQYGIWLKNTMSGDFGESIRYRKPVSEIIGEFIWNSFILNIAEFFIVFGICIPVGIITAVRQYSKTDNFWTVFSLIGVSMPSFFFGIVLIYVFSVKLKILPISGMTTPGANFTGVAHILDVIKHMILPLVVLSIGGLAGTIRFVRNSMLEVIKQDYIRTARSKGLSEKVVIYKHAFRNALIPIVTLIGWSIPILFSGALVIEKIFVWPGLGTVMFGALMQRDYSLVMAMNMFFCILMLSGNLIQDIGYALVDPRVKIE